jgi:putative chitinase
MKLTETQKANIEHIKNACAHIKNPDFLPALLALSYGECGLIPREESCYYSVSRLAQVFPFLSASECQKLAFSKDKNAFFSVVYGPTKRGKGFVGNLTDEDGGLFFGRGYLQLTGRANYDVIGTIISVDLVKQPELVNDPVIGAKVAVAYLQSRLLRAKGATFFDKALNAVGGLRSDDEQVKEYFRFFQSLV